MAAVGDRIFVNAQGASTAQWIRTDGSIFSEEQLPDGGCTISVPSESGFYILRVITDKQERNFKFFVK